MNRPVISLLHEAPAGGAYVQRRAAERIANGDWQGVRFVRMLPNGSHLFSVPSSRAGHEPHMVVRMPDGSYHCPCESTRACHHPSLIEEWRRQQVWQRQMEADWTEHMEARA